MFRICDSVTVFRDGQFISRHATSEITQSQLVSLMVGREMKDIYPKQQVKIGGPVLRVEHFSQPGPSSRTSPLKCTAARSSALPAWSARGARRSCRRCLASTRMRGGKVFLRGQEVHNTNATAAIRNKFALVTEDRLRRGAIHLLSGQSNATIAYLRTVTHHGFIDKRGRAQGRRGTSCARSQSRRLPWARKWRCSPAATSRRSSSANGC